MSVILSEAKNPGSFLLLDALRTTAEILRFAQDDRLRLSSHFLTRQAKLCRPGVSALTYAMNFGYATLLSSFQFLFSSFQPYD